MKNGILTPTLLVWAIFVGIVLAIVCVTTQKSSVNLFISQLFNKCCFDKESAKTLSELGINSSMSKRIILSALKGQTGLRRVTGSVLKSGDVIEIGDISYSSYTELDKFFIDSSQSDKIKKKYAYKKSNPTYIALLIAALAIVAAVATFVIPKLTDYANGVFSSFGDSASSSTHDQTQNQDQGQNNDESDTEEDGNPIDEEKNNEESKSDISDEILPPKIPQMPTGGGATIPTYNPSLT